MNLIKHLSNKHPTFFGVLVLMASLIPQQSFAQLEEIMVTAERRDASEQDTPISIAAFSANDIERLHIQAITDIGAVTPNLNVTEGWTGGASALDFNIRGVGGGGVALYIDDVFYPAIERSALSMYDIESIEVLRGPQGTLFGRNATAGAIRISTVKPHDSLAGKLKATGGEFGQIELGASVNVPLTDSVFLKASLAHIEKDGFMEYRAGRPDKFKGGASESQSINLALRWLASDTVTVDLLTNYSDTEGTPLARMNSFADYRVSAAAGRSLFRTVPGAYESIFLANGEPALNGTLNDPRLLSSGDWTHPGYCILDDIVPETNTAEICLPRSTNEHLQTTLKADWDINENHDLALTVGYHDITDFRHEDPLGLGGLVRFYDITLEAFEFEAVFSSTLFGGAMDLTYGTNYYTSKRTYLAGGASNSRDAFADGVGAESLLDNNDETNAFGLFAQADYHLTDRTTLTLGLRYTDEDQEANIRTFEATNFNIDIAADPARGIAAFSCDTASSFFNPPDPVTGQYTWEYVYDPSCSLSKSANGAWEEVDWKAGIKHSLTDNLMVFGTASKAYKSGVPPKGRNVVPRNVDPSVVTLNYTNPEQVISYEVGFRSEWLDNRVRLNATAFHMDFTDRQQILRVDDASGDVTSRPVTVGDVAVDGVELDLLLAPTDGLTLGLSYGYNKSDLKDPEPPTVVHITAAPENSFNATADYMMMAGAGDLTFGLSYTWQDDFYSLASEGTADDAITDAYGTLNARVSYNLNSWTFTLGVTNLLDDLNVRRLTHNAAVFAGQGLPGPPSATFDRTQSNIFTTQDVAAPRAAYLSVEKLFGAN